MQRWPPMLKTQMLQRTLEKPRHLKKCQKSCSSANLGAIEVIGAIGADVEDYVQLSIRRVNLLDLVVGVG
jgi:hypothetical protein